MDCDMYLTERDYIHPDDGITFHTRYFIPKTYNMVIRKLVQNAHIFPYESYDRNFRNQYITMRQDINFSIGKQNGT